MSLHKSIGEISSKNKNSKATKNFWKTETRTPNLAVLWQWTGNPEIGGSSPPSNRLNFWVPTEFELISFKPDIRKTLTVIFSNHIKNAD